MSLATLQRNVISTESASPFSQPQRTVISTAPPSPFSHPQRNVISIAPPIPFSHPQRNVISIAPPSPFSHPQRNVISTAPPIPFSQPQRNVISTAPPSTFSQPQRSVISTAPPIPFSPPQRNVISTAPPIPFSQPQRNVISTAPPIPFSQPHRNVISTAPPIPFSHLQGSVISTGASRPHRDAQWRDPRISLFCLAPLRQLALVLCFLATLTCTAQKPASKITGQAIYNLTQQYVNAAPHRYVGSPDHAAAEAFIKGQFAPEIAKGTFETDSFVASTPIGMVPMRNYIARYPGKKDGIIVLASHYETNYPLKDIDFVGANDGACTSALLIEIAHYLRAHPPEGYSVWIVLDDGEEAIKEWSDSDSLYGTRHLAAKWSKDGTITKIKAFLLADMIGDKDLNIDHDSNSTPWLLDTLKQAAKNTGHASSIFKNETTVNDDHLPFRQRNVPVLDIIDIDYGPHTNQTPDGYHHTAQDTMDKISPRSLQISADLFLETIHLINEHK